MLLALPHAFLAKVLKAEQGVTLPASPAAGGPGGYAVAQLFMPRDEALRAQVTAIFTRIAAQVGLCWAIRLTIHPLCGLRPDRMRTGVSNDYASIYVV